MIVLTTYDGDKDIYRKLGASANGYALNNTQSYRLMAVMRGIHNGQQYIPLR
ncbi:hypothetical protein H6G33_08790 [Calothrix sp. FACHB-1219]|uniref:hypothetical protein n=1 Tax=unclassified Calothrix TaxID=2619626 RepID=UPI0016898E03|nr:MULTISPECIES: hypothetical protein [unclassified Calothrix]MBD2202092.1 hypothetical protein [Calothrix sp. FACHB-168]MBD2217126.1 hypothetical protein [Calothrix sp. FACHB-1219]